MDVGLHEVFVAVVVEYSARGVGVEVSGGFADLVESDIVVFHLLRIEQNLVFGHVATDHRHLGDTAEGEQSRGDDAVSDGAQFDGRLKAVGRSQADNEHFAEDG